MVRHFFILGRLERERDGFVRIKAVVEEGGGK